MTMTMTMTTLPDDILLFNILPRLPAKVVNRFRLVCKSWNSFIGNPSFIHLRKLTKSVPSHHLLFLLPDPQISHGSTSQARVFSAPFNPNNNIVTTPLRPSLLFTLPFPYLNFLDTQIQCVNGLLCFHTVTALFTSLVLHPTIVVNPTTKQVITLPIDEAIYKKFKVSTHFGYDPVRDEFKVLRLFKYDDGSREFKIFTLGSDTSWRVVTAKKPLAAGLITLMHPEFSYSDNKKGFCANGAIYWRNSTALVIFDVGTEQFREIPVPSGYSNTRWSEFVLVEIDGCLSLVRYSYSCLKLWILRNCETQLWEQKTVIVPFDFEPFYPLCRVPTGEILLMSRCLDSNGCVRGIYYDIDTMSSTSVVVMEIPKPLRIARTILYFDILYCQESFLLLK